MSVLYILPGSSNFPIEKTHPKNNNYFKSKQKKHSKAFLNESDPKQPSNSKGVKAFNVRFGWNFRITLSKVLFQLFSYTMKIIKIACQVNLGDFKKSTFLFRNHRLINKASEKTCGEEA